MPSLASQLITGTGFLAFPSGFGFKKKKLHFSFPAMMMTIFFGFQVEEEASDTDNKNCSNNGERQPFFGVII